MKPILVLPLLLLSACASPPSARTQIAHSPMSFHDARYQYALLTDDRMALRRDFGVVSRPSWLERVIAGVALPIDGAVETAFWPAFAAIRAYNDR
jgi:hypothetical protein